MMNKEEIVRNVIKKVINDKKITNKDKDHLLCIGNDWVLLNQRIDKAIEHTRLKIIRYTNEQDYLINVCDLEELLEILKGVNDD